MNLRKRRKLALFMAVSMVAANVQSTGLAGYAGEYVDEIFEEAAREEETEDTLSLTASDDAAKNDAAAVSENDENGLELIEDLESISEAAGDGLFGISFDDEGETETDQDNTYGYDITNGLTDEQIAEIIDSAVFFDYTPDEEDITEGDDSVGLEAVGESVYEDEPETESVSETAFETEAESITEAESETEVETEAVTEAADELTDDEKDEDSEVPAILTWEEFYADQIQNYDLSSMSELEQKDVYVLLRNSYIVYRDEAREAAAEDAEEASEEEADPLDGTLEASDEETLSIEDVEDEIIGLDNAAEDETIILEEDIELPATESYDSAGLQLASDTNSLSNDYIEVNVYESGSISIGNVSGDPDYDSDDGQKLLYGHPSGSTSETLIRVNGNDYVFTADLVVRYGNRIVAVMDIKQDETDVTVTQEVELVPSGQKSFDDAVQISYTVQNNMSEQITVGVRIMLDTMLASNDHAPFKVPGTGNLTTQREYVGSEVPDYYQVYDNLDSPTTLATGYLKNSGRRTPDKVQFANWGGIRGSGWTYSVSEGSSLGDSAVGIYFDEIGVPGGSSTDVSTQYGVGLGTKSGQLDTLSLSGDEVGFRVQDLTTGDNLEGVTLTLENGQTLQTDSNGLAVADLAEVNGKQVTFEKSGYDTKSVTSEREGGRKYTVNLKKTGDDTPEIKSIILTDGNESVDLLQTTANYTQDASDLITNADKSAIKKVNIKVECDTPDCTYYLMQDGKPVLKGTSGTFTLKTIAGSGKDYDYIEKLKPGKSVYVRVLTKEGVKTTEEILLNVMSPSLSFDFSKLSKASFSFLEDPSSASASNLLLQIIAGGDSKLKLGADSKSKITWKIDVPNKSLKIGLNAKNGLFEDQTATRTFKNGSKHSFNKSTGSTNAEKKRYDNTIKRWQAKNTKYTVGKTSVDFNALGYGEFFWDDDGNLSGNLYIALSLSGSASVTTHFMLWVIPMYATVGGEAKGEVSLSSYFSAFSTSSELMELLSNLAVETAFYLGLNGEIGAGDGELAKIGGKIKAGLNAKYNWQTTYYKNSIDGELSLEAKAFLWEKSYKLASASWTISEGYKNGGASGSRVTASDDVVDTSDEEDEVDIIEELMAQPTQMVSRDYLTLEETVAADESVYADDASDISEDETSEAVLTNVYTEAQPKLISAGGKQYRFWLQDITSREAQNRTALAYAVNDGNGWGERIILEDDGTADFDYSVAVAEDAVYVAWQDCNTVFDSTVDLLTMSQGVDITMAKISTTTDTVETVYAVSADSLMDLCPALCISADSVYVAWNSTQSSVFESVRGSRLNYRVLQQGTLTDTVSFDLSDKSVENLQLISSSAQVKAVYSLVEWDDALSRKSQQTNSRILSDGQEETDLITSAENTPTVATIGGTEYLFWYANQNICYTGLADHTDEMTVFVQDQSPASLNPLFTVVDAGEKTYLIWSGQDSTDEEADRTMQYAYTTVYEGGSWSEVYKLTELSEGQIRNLSGVSHDDGTITLSWMSQTYDENDTLTSSQIHTKEVGTQNSFIELQITDIEYDEYGAPAGEAFAINLVLRNNGSSVVDEADVRISYDGGYDEEQGKTFAGFDMTSRLTGLALAPGEVTERQLSFTIPESGSHEYVVEITPENADGVTGTNSFEVGRTTLSIVDHGTILDDDMQSRFIEIVNDSHVPAENVRIRLFDGTQDGVLLYASSLGDIEGGKSRFVTVPEAVFDGVSAIYAYLYTDTYTGDDAIEVQLGNANRLIRELDSSDFTIEAGEGGKIVSTHEDEYLETAEVTIQAEAEAGYAFWQWETNAGSIEDTWAAETTFTMPAEAVVIRAVFRALKALEEMTVELPDGELTVGESTQLNITVSPEDVSEHTHITSSDTAVVKVSDDGTLEIVGPGSAEITITCGELTEKKTITIDPVAIDTIELAGPVYLDGIGSTEEMMPLITPENATEKVVWTSDAPDIVSVDENGIITALKAGSANITAMAADHSGVRAVCEVYVTQQIEELIISDTSLTMLKGETKDISVSVLPAEMSETADISWEISDSDGTVLQSAVDETDSRLLHVTAGANAGTVLVRARVGEDIISDYCRIKVEIPVEQIELTDTSLDLLKGDSKTILSAISPSNTTDTVTWSSSDTSVAVVDAYGYVWAVSPGDAVITANSTHGASAQCIVHVYEVPATNITLTASSMQLTIGSSEGILQAIVPENTTDDIVWSSSDTGVASVYNGQVTAVSEGTAVISAAASSGVSASCTVTVVPKVIHIVSDVSELYSGDAESGGYDNNAYDVWQYTVTGADYLDVTFNENCALENNYDYVTIQDKDGNVVGRYTGDTLAGAVVRVQGDTVRILLTSDGSVNSGYGFRVDKVEAGGEPVVPDHTDDETPDTGSEDTKDPGNTSVDSGTGTVGEGSKADGSTDSSTGSGSALDSEPMTSADETSDNTDTTSTAAASVTTTITADSPVVLSAVQTLITSQKSDSDAKGSSYALLQASAKAKSKTSIKVSWTKVDGATGYLVYGNKCGKSNKYKLLKTTTKASYTQKKLKKGTYYKYLVVAVKDDTALAMSKTIHVATKGGKVTNPSSVKLNKTSKTLKSGKTFTVKATVKAASTALKLKSHRKVKFESSDPSIAKVSSKGKITAVKKGACYIYAYAQNGVYSRIKIKVK